MIKWLKDYFISFPSRSVIHKVLVIVLIVIQIFFLCITTIYVDYEIVTPGVLQLSTGDVLIKDGHDSGKVLTVGVYSTKRISIFQKWLVETNKKMDLFPYDPVTDLSNEEYTTYATLLKANSITKSIIVAYEAAAKIDPNIVITKEFHGLLVTAKFPYANTQAQVGDVITKLNDIQINNLEDFIMVAQTIGETDVYEMTVIRDFGRDSERTITLGNNQRALNPATQTYLMGIAVDEFYTIDRDSLFPEFTVDPNFRSIGSSGGGMLTLAIYNSLLEEDITKGMTIVGTGTIQMDGSIGAVGALKQKIYTAAKYNVNVFFVPKDSPLHNNYSEALDAYQELFKNSEPTFDLVAIETFDDILEYLLAIQTEGDS